MNKNKNNNIHNIVNYLIKKRKECSPHNDEGHKHSCAILYKGNILGIGTNKYIPRPGLKMARTIHAEMDAINKNIHKIGNKKIDLLVVRTNKGNSKCCANCLDSMFSTSLRIKNIYYTAGEDKIVKEHFNSLYNSDDKHISSYNLRFGKNCDLLNNCISNDVSECGGCCDDEEEEEEELTGKRKGKKKNLA